MISKFNINKVLILFMFSHLILWTLVPSITNINLPLDTIEALAWASNLEWGYTKHPPLSALTVGLIYYVFGSIDWTYYLLSQIFILISFFYVWKLSKEFFSNDLFPLLSVLILESIVFFNYTSPEFNVYVCQLPFKAMTVYFFWRGIKHGKLKDWLLTGFLCAMGLLTHYSFLFLIISLLIFFLFFAKKTKKNMINFFLSLIIFLLIFTPHLFWLYENNFNTISYALDRTGVDNKNLIDHIFNPFIFLLKQAGIMLLFFLTFFSVYSFKKKRIHLKKMSQKKWFLISISIIPFILVFIISMITGAKIRTMWMSSFYLFNGLVLIYFLRKKIELKKIKNFLIIIIFIFFLSPITYTYISLSNDSKRTDYPGKEISRLVQNKWDQNFTSEIKIVIGDEWYAGNLSYHLPSRPVWMSELNQKNISDNNILEGVIYTGNPKVLKKLCPGVYGTIKPVGYCMIGRK